MGARVQRLRLAEGVYQDRYGVSVMAKVGNLQREIRHPLGTDLEILKSARLQLKAQLDAERGTVRPVTGTLRADAQKWIARKKGHVSFKSERSHLAAWYPALGETLRSAISRERVETIIAGWRESGVALRTIRHRCRVLRELYQALDGPKAANPLDGVRVPVPPAPTPKAVPHTTIRDVAASLKKAKRMKDYARFLVRATTGQRPAQIMRAEPGDVDLKRRLWFVRPSKGGVPVLFPLDANAVKAWQAFIKAKAWGAFDTAVAADVLRKHGWPEGVRPYDLRHTFAIDMLLKGADLGNVQGLLGHTQIQTTRTHYAPIQTALLRRAVAKRGLKLP
jgi:integrase